MEKYNTTCAFVWGKGRKMRAPEIVLSMIKDPIRAGPLAAIDYKHLNDARRLMRKSKARLDKAISISARVAKVKAKPMKRGRDR